MQLRRFCKWMIVAGVFLIWAVKFGIRPYVPLSSSIKFVAGVAPNLFAGFLTPFGAYWLYTHAAFANGRLMRFEFFSDNRIICIFGFSLAVVNEYLQLIPVFGRTFDYYDIIFSAVGLVCAYYIFEALQKTLIMSYDRQ